MSKHGQSQHDDDLSDDEGGLSAENVPLRNLRRHSLDSIGSSNFDHLLEDDISEVSSTDLPSVDGGRAAWTFLLGCWLVEALIWSFPLSFGVFQEYYTRHELFQDSSAVPTIGTLATGISYMGMPLTNMVVVRWPQHRRIMCITGWAMCIFGLVGASFATNVKLLLLYQGLMYGTGWVVCYTPFLFMLNEWFDRKRGLAYGILFGASGVAGLAVPNIIGWLLRRFGFRAALRVYALAILCASGPGIFLIRPRIPVSTIEKLQKSSVPAVEVLRLLSRNLHFYIFVFAVFVQGLGFFIPNIYITSFSSALGMPTSSSAGLLAMISLSQVMGQIFQGWISDRVNVYIPLSLSALLPGLGAVFLWGPAKGMSYLAPFALLWGFFSASYSVLFTRICSFLAQDTGLAGDDGIAMLLYGFFSFERGVANVLEGPISSWLVDGSEHSVDVSVERFALGKYASVVWFTAVCMLSASLVGFGLITKRSNSDS